MNRFTVPVDSGVIEMARNPNHLDQGGALYGKTQDLALWTALAVWDGKKGAIGTPHGDGPHDVVYESGRSYAWKEWQDKKTAMLVNLPRGEKGKAFTLYLGDAGHGYGSIDFPEHNLIAFGWENDYTLVFMVE
jgi:hypothetical protein